MHIPITKRLIDELEALLIPYGFQRKKSTLIRVDHQKVIITFNVKSHVYHKVYMCIGLFSVYQPVDYLDLLEGYLGLEHFSPEWCSDFNNKSDDDILEETLHIFKKYVLSILANRITLEDLINIEKNLCLIGKIDIDLDECLTIDAYRKAADSMPLITKNVDEQSWIQFAANPNEYFFISPDMMYSFVKMGRMDMAMKTIDIRICMQIILYNQLLSQKEQATHSPYAMNTLEQLINGNANSVKNLCQMKQYLIDSDTDKLDQELLALEHQTDSSLRHFGLSLYS